MSALHLYEISQVGSIKKIDYKCFFTVWSIQVDSESIFTGQIHFIHLFTLCSLTSKIDRAGTVYILQLDDLRNPQNSSTTTFTLSLDVMSVVSTIKS